MTVPVAGFWGGSGTPGHLWPVLGPWWAGMAGWARCGRPWYGAGMDERRAESVLFWLRLLGVSTVVIGALLIGVVIVAAVWTYELGIWG